MTGSSAIRPLIASDSAAALTLYTELTFGPKTKDANAFEAVLSHPSTTIYGAFDATALVAMLTLHLLP